MSNLPPRVTEDDMTDRDYDWYCTGRRIGFIIGVTLTALISVLIYVGTR